MNDLIGQMLMFTGVLVLVMATSIIIASVVDWRRNQR